jgi:carbon-monoxide dehydrogenase large subunit
MLDALDPPPLLGAGRFAVGQPVPRSEDPVLLRGQGRYSDDEALPGQAYAVVVRSRHAHGVLRAVDAAAARAMPGVLAVVLAQDLAAGGIGVMPAGASAMADGAPAPRPAQPPLAAAKVRYVGDPVAVVVAETLSEARDAAEAVLLDVDALPAVTTAGAALAPGAPLVHDDAPGNMALTYRAGDAAAVEVAFARAAHVARLAIRNSRVVVAPLEPRSALAAYDEETGRYTLRVGCQGVFGLRAALAGVLGVGTERVRVLTGRVGGSFGMKASVYPEYPAILHAARALGRPVKWTDERSGSFLSDSHGRDAECEAELALDADGRFLAVRLSLMGNLGAYLGNAATLPATVNALKNVVGTYATPAVAVASRLAFTNTTPVGPYRGAGRPEGNLYMERLVDQAAAELGLDPAELRRRNHIAPRALPYKAPSGMLYDSGDFPALLDRALTLADWAGFPARAAESTRQGKLRGRGIGQYLEVTAPPTREMGGITFEPDGTVTFTTGTLDYGQGHATPFAQIIADRLGVPFEAIRLVQGDSDRLVAGGGTGGSKSLMASGAAAVEACALVVEQGREAAAHALEAAASDIEFGRGRFTVAGTDRGVGVMELAAWLRANPGAGASLDVVHVHESSPSAFPNGCHVAEVEVDPETGTAAVARYAAVGDFGVEVNPLLVRGQVQGGVVQGIGQALLEQVAYDADGQLLSGSFMDYALPRAADAPGFAMASHPVPARTNGLGVKGCGEAGCAGSLPAVMNALMDALRPAGVAHLDMPATPERVWRALRGASLA